METAKFTVIKDDCAYQCTVDVLTQNDVISYRLTIDCDLGQFSNIAMQLNPDTGRFEIKSRLYQVIFSDVHDLIAEQFTSVVQPRKNYSAGFNNAR